MSGARLVVLVPIAILTAQVAAGADGVDFIPHSGAASPATAASTDTAPGASTSGNAAAPQQPFLHPSLPNRITAKLEYAIPIALQHLEQHETCQALFARFKADGIDLLGQTLYAPLTATEKRRYCSRGTVAVTAAGGPVTKPCPYFSRLSDERAAVTLIHEALHFAGQPEAPFDRDAPTSFGITRMVISSCGF
jgi:hypothetical protein